MSAKSKITGQGLIAITNWHLFMDREQESPDTAAAALDSVPAIVKELLPLTPGTLGGNDLKALDAAHLRGGEIEFLAALPNLVVINDEAHHIHENRTYGEVQEVEWQKSLKRIAEKKGKAFIQLDFSATPFDVTGSGQNRTKPFFPHIIADFDLVQAVRKGLVKTIAIDKRKEIVELSIDYRAEPKLSCCKRSDQIRAYSEALAQRVRKILKNRQGITEKRMFGGLCLLSSDKMFQAQAPELPLTRSQAQ